jgi:UDP-N-acetylglucosamine--N-acetylmuramyl-(pentapeptide) pyrophosphoryl-undecaprenol N-acetylglucosamine transferase
LELVSPVPLSRSVNADLFKTPARLRASVNEAVEILDRHQPEVVVGFGGYVSVPAYLAARKRKFPLVVHEGNALPGIANKLGARFTDFVATSFPGTRLPHAICTGLPIRRMIATLDRGALRAEASSFFSLDADLPTLLVTGGSQGAERINQSVAAAAGALADAGVQVLHIVGPKNALELTPDPDAPVPYVVLPYVEEMQYAYAAADFVLCRAGAMTCAELTAVGLPAAYVPLPLRGGEQRFNAEPIVAAGGGLLVDNDELTPEWIIEQIVPRITDPERLAAMGRAAAQTGSRDADIVLARHVLNVVAEHRRFAGRNP